MSRKLTALTVEFALGIVCGGKGGGKDGREKLERERTRDDRTKKLGYCRASLVGEQVCSYDQSVSFAILPS